MRRYLVISGGIQARKREIIFTSFISRVHSKQNDQWKMSNEKWKMLGNLTGEALNDRDQFFYLNRLRNMGIVTRSDRAYAILSSCISSQGNGRNLLAFSTLLITHLPDQVVTIGIRHPDIADQQIELLGTQEEQALPRLMVTPRTLRHAQPGQS